MANLSLKDKAKHLQEAGWTVVPKDSMQCLDCEKIRAINGSSPLFYVTTSERFKSCKAYWTPHGWKEEHLKKKNIDKPQWKTYIPYCKDCLSKNLDWSNINTVIDTLSLMDKPFIKSLYDSVISNYLNTKTSPKGMLGHYLRMLAMQHSDNCFKDSDNWIVEEKIEKLSENNIPIEIKDKYGYGYKDEEYLNFERKYKKMTVGYKEKTSIHTERFLDYIIKKVKEEMAIADGNVTDAAKYETMAKNAAQAAKLNVSQLSKSDITGGIDLIPQLIEAIEEHASLIPLMPKLKEVPYDDADLIIWGIINKIRRLEDKSEVEYREIWDFYDDMLQEHFTQKGYDEKRIEEEIKKRETPFRDLGKIYIEPLYADEDGDDNGT